MKMWKTLIGACLVLVVSNHHSHAQGFEICNPNTIFAGPASGGIPQKPACRALVAADVAGLTGGVSTVSVVSANGFFGSVSNPTTTPAITIGTSASGILQGNGTNVSAITVGSGLTFSGGMLSASGGAGSVTTVSVASANGFGGSVANPTTTPAITLTTSISGPLKGSASALAAATATDLLSTFSGTCNSSTFARGDGSCQTPAGSGNVNAGGTLTSNSTVLGAGTTAVQTVAGLTTDGVGRYIAGVSTTQAGTVQLFGGTSGSSILTPPLVAGTGTVITLPNAASTLPILPQQITVTGPTAARTWTVPDASFTLARTDAANTFTGASTGTSWTMTTPVVAGGLTASGSGNNDFSGSTGAFLTSTGAVTIGTGAVGITGALTITGPAATTGLTFTQTARTSGILPYIKYTIPTDTAQTAATESPGILGVTGTRTWATTGTVALQREIFFPGPTYASASASQTFTDAFNMYLTPPVAGANAIFTRGHTLGIVDATSAASAVTGGLVVATTLGTAATSVGIGAGNVNAGAAITAGSTVSSGTTMTAGTGFTVTSGASALKQTTIAGAAATTALTITQTARTSGVLPYITWTIPTDTAQTAATESPGLKVTTGTRTWATTGTVPLQRENYFAGPTYASASASQTFTDPFTVYIDAPIVGTNAIFTRPHTLGIVDATSASSSITGGLVVATTLGTAATSVGIGGGNINAGGTLITGGAQTVAGGTAIPAGGTAGVGQMFSSTANFGVFFGSGAPTLTAAQGSIYLRSDGAGAVYANTTGSTTWSALSGGSGIATVGDTSTSPAFSGTNGTTLTGTNAGGLTLTAASGATAPAINITGATATTSANTGGAINITSGTPGATGQSGAVTITTANSPGNVPGNVNITTGTGVGGGAGNIVIKPGTLTGAPGASVNITAGAAASSTQNGGQINIVGGAVASGSSAVPGLVTIKGGPADTNTASGSISIITQSGGATSGNSGSIILATGGGNSSFGDIIFQPAGSTMLDLNPNTSVAAFTGKITVSGFVNNTAAQTGTLCYNTTGGVITYDASATCLVSLEELKDIQGPITGALREIMLLKPIWASYKKQEPFKDFEVHPMFGARHTNVIDPRLTSHNEDGAVRGVRYQEMTALLTAAIQEQQREIAELKRQVNNLLHGNGANKVQVKARVYR